jgi:hypothetical protein
VTCLLTLFRNMGENENLKTVLVYHESNVVMSKEDGGCKQDECTFICT